MIITNKELWSVQTGRERMLECYVLNSVDVKTFFKCPKVKHKLLLVSEVP